MSGEKILVVDDDQDLRETLAMFLMRLHYQPEGAPNGEKAWKLLQENSYDLVVLDIMMPGMSGFDLLERIRQSEDMADLPVIMVTALDKTSDIVKAFQAGANDYITKPFVNAELIARVSSALRQTKVEQARSSGLELASFKKALGKIEREINQPLIQLTRCSRQLFKNNDEISPNLQDIRRILYDQCVRIQVILKQLEKIKSLNP